MLTLSNEERMKRRPTPMNPQLLHHRSEHHEPSNGYVPQPYAHRYGVLGRHVSSGGKL
jgi:hypothetical protein